MALTRAMLKGMSLTDEQVDAIINEHIAVTSPLKDQINEYKETVEKLEASNKELEKLKAEVSQNKEWEKKFNTEHTEFEKYKSEVSAKEELEKKKSAFKKLLNECNIGEKHVDSIIRVTDFSSINLNDKNELENVDKLKESINADYSGFVVTRGTKGAGVETPPEGGKPSTGGRASELAAKYHENLYGKVKEA